MSHTAMSRAVYVVEERIAMGKAVYSVEARSAISRAVCYDDASMVSMATMLTMSILTLLSSLQDAQIHGKTFHKLNITSTQTLILKICQIGLKF